MRPPPRRDLALALACAFGTLLGPGVASADAPPSRAVALGVSLAPGAGVPDGVTAEPDRPMWVRLAIPWPSVEVEPGVYDWSAVEPAVTAARAAGLRVVLGLVPGDRPTSGASLEAWTGFVRSAVRAFAGQVSVVEVGGLAVEGEDGAVAAFTLKAAALAARAESRAAGAEILVAQSPMDAERLDSQRALWENDAAAYVDVLPVTVRASEGAEEVPERLLAVLREAAAHPPAAALWAYVEPAAGAPPAAAVRGAIRAIAATSPVALVSLPEDPVLARETARVAAGLNRRLEPGFAPAPVGRLGLRTPEGAERPDLRILGRFLHDKDFRTVVVYDAPAGGTTGGQARLVLDTADVKDPKVVDPLREVELLTGPGPVPGVSRPALRLLLADHPMAVAWERAASAAPGLELPPEELEVRESRGLTAEEIIARFQAAQKVQDDRLDRWVAKGRLEYHFKLGQAGSTFDIAIESNYFWERGAPLEWEQTDYFVNGNRITWKDVPELPIVQPEKVLTLPLDLTLDRTYTYRLVGEDEVDGRPAYVLSFEPADPEAPKSLYRGRLWIDKETFERLKQSLVQTNLEPPVVSNEEVDAYEVVAGPDGFPYRVLTRQDGQQLWVVAGRNLVVRRELTFRDLRINPVRETFEEERTRAYASRNRMLRDTDAGFRYLDRGDDGSRTVREKEKRAYWFLAGGAFEDDSTDGVVPVLGASYINYDLFKKNQQINVLFGGVVAFVNYTNPGALGGRADVAVEGTGIAIKRDDRVFVAGEEVVAERLRERGQYLSGRIGFPLGSFVKLTLVGDLEVHQYFDSDEGEAARPPGQTFVLPRDHRVLGATTQLEFNRRGWTVSGWFSASRRSEWEPWGLYDTESGSFVDSEYDPEDDAFETWGATAFKEWYLPKFQKLRAEVNYLDGTGLDRFSRYAFSQFGSDRLNGFAGTGVRFERGFIGRGGYSFNLFNAVRLDVAAETARVEGEGAGAPWQSHTGVGVSTNVVGPWKTLISFSYGRALASDVPELEGKQEFLLFILKLF